MEKQELEEEILTTELSDEELDLIYKKYKLLQWRNSDKLKDINQEAYDLAQSFGAGTARTGEDDHKIRSPIELQNEIGMVLNKKL